MRSAPSTGSTTCGIISATGIEVAKVIVEIFAHLGRMTKDAAVMATGMGAASSFPNRRWLTTADDLSQFPSACDSTLRAITSSLAAIVGKRAAKSGVEIELAARAQVVKRGDAPAFAEGGGQGCGLRRLWLRRSYISRVGGAQDSGDGGAADPVGGTFVADGESPAAGTRSVAVAVAAVGDRSRAGDDDHAGAGAKAASSEV